MHITAMGINHLPFFRVYSLKEQTMFRNLIVLIITSMLSFSYAEASRTGGLVWILAPRYFENVDELGYVRLNEKWGTLKLKDGELPLYGIFSSDGKSTSLLLGKGWRLPLFESTAIQKDERTYEVNMPDGRIMMFRQRKNEGDSFRASDVWSGKKKKDLFVVSSIYGIELVYKSGRLSRMKFKNDYYDYNLTFKYRKGVLIELKDYSEVVLRGTMSEDGIIYESQTAKCEYEIKHSEILVGGVPELMLTSVSMGEDKVLYDWTFPTHGASQVKIISEKDKKNKTISWNSTNGYIVSDGEYTFNITPAVSQGSFAAIERTSSNGIVESWYRDNWNGVEEILRADGAKIIRKWYTTGKLVALENYVSISQNGITTTNEYSYDETRKLIRTLTNGEERFFIYDAMGNLAVIVSGNKIVKECIPGSAYLAKDYINE